MVGRISYGNIGSVTETAYGSKQGLQVWANARGNLIIFIYYPSYHFTKQQKIVEITACVFNQQILIIENNELKGY